MALLRPDLAKLHSYIAPVVGDEDKLDANEVGYPLPAWFQDKLGFAAGQVQGHRYPSGDFQVLRGLLADYSGVTADGITVGNGSDELIRSLIMVSCLGQGRGVLSAEPTFSMYRIVAETLGVPYFMTPRNPESFSLDLAALTRVLAQENVGILFLAAPNSPTGTPLTAAELDFLRGLPEDLLVVLDEAYYEFSGSTVVAELAQRPNWVVLRTLSKAFRLAAYRVGYVIAQPYLVTALEKVRLPYNLTALSLAAAELALTHHQELLTVVPLVLAEREQLISGLEQLDIHHWPTVTNFIFCQVPEAPRIHRELAQRGSLVRLTHGGLRVTVGTPPENQRLLGNLQSILGTSTIQSSP